MLKVNNKDTRTSVSIVNFEHVIPAGKLLSKREQSRKFWVKVVDV